MDARLPARLGSELFTEVQVAGAGLNLTPAGGTADPFSGEAAGGNDTSHRSPIIKAAGVDLDHGRPGHRGRSDLPEGSIATMTPLEAASCP